MRARIVIVSYNAREYISAAIESAMAQTVGCQVFVVDNGSEDGSVEWIRSTYPAVRVLESGGNVGFGSAATAGAFAQPLDYDYVAFLNPDAYAKPEWIERLTAWMERENAVLASSTVGTRDRPFYVGGHWRPALGAATNAPAYEGARTQWISGCALVVRRDAFAALGGFDPSYFLYFEDVDLCLRARASGMGIGVYEEELVAHPDEGRSTNTVGPQRKRSITWESKGRLVGSHVRGPSLVTALLFQLFVSPAVNGAGLGEYPDLVRAFLTGFSAGRRSRSRARAPRRQPT